MKKDSLKEIIEMSIHPLRDYTDCIKYECNKKIREEIEKELNRPPSPRQLEISHILEEEKRKWEFDKAELKLIRCIGATISEKDLGCLLFVGKLIKTG